MKDITMKTIMELVAKLKGIEGMSSTDLKALYEEVTSLSGRVRTPEDYPIDGEDILEMGMEAIVTMLGGNHYVTLCCMVDNLTTSNRAKVMNEIGRLEETLPELDLTHYRAILSLGALTTIAKHAMVEIIGDNMLEHMLQQVDELDLEDPKSVDNFHHKLADWYRMVLRNKNISECSIDALLEAFTPSLIKAPKAFMSIYTLGYKCGVLSTIMDTQSEQLRYQYYCKFLDDDNPPNIPRDEMIATCLNIIACDYLGAKRPAHLIVVEQAVFSDLAGYLGSVMNQAHSLTDAVLAAHCNVSSRHYTEEGKDALLRFIDNRALMQLRDDIRKYTPGTRDTFNPLHDQLTKYKSMVLKNEGMVINEPSYMRAMDHFFTS